MNSVLVVGRICAEPIYFPAQPKGRSSLYFCLSVSSKTGTKRRRIDVFNVKCYGELADTTASRIYKSQIVCVRGSVHLDAKRVSMFLYPDSIEIYMRLPSLLGNFDPALGELFFKPRQRFKEAVAACKEGDRLILDRSIQHLEKPKTEEDQKSRKSSTKRTKETQKASKSKSAFDGEKSQMADLLREISVVYDDDSPIIPGAMLGQLDAFPLNAANEGEAPTAASNQTEDIEPQASGMLDEDPWVADEIDALKVDKIIHNLPSKIRNMALPPPRGTRIANGPNLDVQKTALPKNDKPKKGNEELPKAKFQGEGQEEKRSG